MALAPDIPPPPSSDDQGASAPQGAPGDLLYDHPELLVGGAFVGAFLFARLLNRKRS